MTLTPPVPCARSVSETGEGRTWHWHGAVTLPSVREAATAARYWLAQSGAPEDELSAWELLLTEAGNNIAEHGAADGAAARMEMELSILPDRILARITDHTAGFDWPENISLPDEDSESGRGLFLIEALTTARDYLRGSACNILMLERACMLPVQAPPPAENDEIEATLEAMTEELSACYESLSAIFRFTAESRQCVTLTDFAGRLLQHLITVTGADCGMLRVVSGEELTTLAVHGCETPSHAPGPLEAEAMSTRQDQWLEPGDLAGASPPEGGPLAGLVHPFYHGDELMGILSLGRLHSARPLNAGEVNVVHTFAEFFTQQVLSRRHQEAAIQTSVARRELELAAEIQRSLLPRRLPVWPGISIAGHCESALTVGGDFYDIVPRDGHEFFFVVADVMGKGMGASMMAAVTRLAFRSLCQSCPSPARLITQAAALLFDDLDHLEMFVTVATGIVDLRRGEVRIANAGHCPVLVMLPDGLVASCEPTMPPLGLEKNPVCQEVSVPFDPGARLIAYSDGLVDPRDARTPFQSPDELSAWIGKAAQGLPTAGALKDALLERIGCIPLQGPSAAQADDQTILVVARDSTPGLY